MTVTEALATPVPAPVLLTHRIIKARVTSERADADAVTARANLAALEAEYRATLESAA